MFENMYSIGVVNPKLKTGEMQLRCNYEDGTWYLFAQLPQMSKVEAMNIQTGKISLAFAIIEDELFLLGKFGVLDWFDMPYEPARFKEPQKYIEFPSESGAPVVVVGADSNTGMVKALRAFGMSNSMSNALHKVCRDMDIRHRPLNVKNQHLHIQKIYQKYPNSASMLRQVMPAHITIIS